AVVADAPDLPLAVVLPHRGPAHAKLARKAGETGHLVERHVVAWLVHGEHVHQVEVPRVVAVNVVVVPEVAVVLALVPELERAAAVQERAAIKHRQIESRTVPRHQLRGVPVDAVEEFLDDRRLVALWLGDGENLDVVAFAQYATDDDDALQVRRQAIAPVPDAAL